jgi:hypothetical protein
MAKRIAVFGNITHFRLVNIYPHLSEKLAASNFRDII